MLKIPRRTHMFAYINLPNKFNYISPIYARKTIMDQYIQIYQSNLNECTDSYYSELYSYNPNTKYVPPPYMALVLIMIITSISLLIF